MDFNYKKYSLEQLENWVHDSVNGDASPQEIYDLIKGVVDEQYHYHKHHTGRCYDLLALLNGNGKGHIRAYDDFLSKDRNSNFPGENTIKDKVKKWVLPVEVDGSSAEYFVTFPDDLLEAANLKEGDQIEWVDNGDGSYTICKVTKEIKMEDC
jgi:antitoxin component of MazEF toxin-antitoxin module